MPDLYDIACCFIRRIVAKKHQNIESRLRQVQFLTERSAESVVGKGGLTDNMIEQMNLAFEAREIFKVYVLKNSELEVRAVCDEIVSRTGAEPVSVVGSKFVLYKPSSEKPKIVLPR